jgi:membrane protease YdiL (CAAX protease family)
VALTLFITFTGIMFFAYRFHGENLFEKQQFILKISVQMILIVIGFQIIVNVPFNFFISKLLHSSRQGSNYFVFDFSSWLVLLNVIILGPIVEEWIFRGCFLRGLLTKHSDKKAIIITAIIFALVHGSPVQMFGAFILGLYFGKIYVKTKSITTTIILHAIANLSGIAGKYLVAFLFL